MLKKILFLFMMAGMLVTSSHAQDSYPKNLSIDVRNYVFNLHLNDEDNEIEGEALITVDFKDKVEHFSLDLIGKSGEHGMEVIEVLEDSTITEYRYANDKIIIRPKFNGPKTKTFSIRYHGVPERGLVIDTTKFGQRSFFGDNWPNLARHWLPCVDHPYDKAAVEFRITAPDHYDVVATGEKIEESNLNNGFKLTTYREPAPVAMKVVTIGVTKFASKLLGMVGDIPVTAWVYPENRLDGFSDYAVSTDVMDYFVDHIGPYAYAKLANMQAKTQWGGLENAGTISYFENSVTGKNEVEGLIAHEIAHQWFGNSASEANWNHVWLSEGFATYFSILYLENTYGDEKRKEELVLDRKQTIEYYAKNPAPVVDNSIIDPLKVLSTNTYQKGGWVLNMLRHQLGDDIFWKGIRTYYETYENSNALTKDFQAVMESVSGKNLANFFSQWIFTKGHPVLKWNWNYRKGKLVITIDQVQGHHIFDFPLEIGIQNGEAMKIELVEVNGASKTYEIKVDSKPTDVILDPNVWLLFEEK
ncbi:M1 family aminopeptidase [Maribacter algicola]|uniref:M1 family aminopeptidase n=1 Tax=Meishania litoralis TaxID=3434685 RepID=A0ACC7LIH0_9FLAO